MSVCVINQTLQASPKNKSLNTAQTMDPITAHPYLSEEQQRELHDIATALSRPGGGILAADETPKAMEARFASLKIENTPEVSRVLCGHGEGFIF